MIEGTKTIAIGLFMQLLTAGCVAPSTDAKGISDREIAEDVALVAEFAAEFRDNPYNEGGDETTIYMPGTYFNPDPEHIADQRPVWMRSPEAARVFLVAIISADRGFDKRCWNAFFQGIGRAEKSGIVEYALMVKERDYIEICQKFSPHSSLSYEQYKSKVNYLAEK
jgi:hypothetical protein